MGVRVDVTLRGMRAFSGDAFCLCYAALRSRAGKPSQSMKEPGNGNTIRANVQARKQTLLGQGMDEEQAAASILIECLAAKPGCVRRRLTRFNR